MNGGRDHAADDWGSDGFHHIGADAAFPQDGDEARKNHAHGHELRPEALHRTFNGGFFDVFVFDRFSGCEPAVECLMQLDNHDHTGLNRNSKQRDVADPDCHAEVVAK
jgi:hypothetical protein